MKKYVIPQLNPSQVFCASTTRSRGRKRQETRADKVNKERKCWRMQSTDKRVAAMRSNVVAMQHKAIRGWGKKERIGGRYSSIAIVDSGLLCLLCRSSPPLGLQRHVPFFPSSFSIQSCYCYRLSDCTRLLIPDSRCHVLASKLSFSPHFAAF